LKTFFRVIYAIKLGHDDTRPPRQREGITAVLTPGQKSGKRLTAKTRSRKFERSQRVSEPPVECGSSLDRPKRHRRFNEEPNEHDRVARDALLIRLPAGKRGREQMPTPLTGPGLNVSLSNVTDAAMTTSTPETRRALAAPCTIIGGALGPEPYMISNSIPNSATSWPESCPAGADERTSKKAGVATKSSRKRRSLPDALSSHSVTNSQTPAEITEAGTTAELDRDIARIGAMACEHHGGVSALAYTFDSVAGEIPGDEDDPHDFTSNEYRGTSPTELEKKLAVNLPLKPRLPVRPPIWAQVRRLSCGKNFGHMVSSLDRKCARLLTPSEVFKVASITPMTSSKGIFSELTPLGHSTYYLTLSFA
jgi:hypothetical protein